MFALTASRAEVGTLYLTALMPDEQVGSMGMR
jgi:hypothetical protein